MTRRSFVTVRSSLQTKVRLTALILAGEEPADRERQSAVGARTCSAMADMHLAGHWGENTIEMPRSRHLTLGRGDFGLATAEPLRLAELTGIEPGVFRHLQKVTSVE